MNSLDYLGNIFIYWINIPSPEMCIIISAFFFWRNTRQYMLFSPGRKYWDVISSLFKTSSTDFHVLDTLFYSPPSWKFYLHFYGSNCSLTLISSLSIYHSTEVYNAISIWELFKPWRFAEWMSHLEWVLSSRQFPWILIISGFSLQFLIYFN
jgi:hypothetical protein